MSRPKSSFSTCLIWTSGIHFDYFPCNIKDGVGFSFSFSARWAISEGCIRMDGLLLVHWYQSINRIGLSVVDSYLWLLWNMSRVGFSDWSFFCGRINVMDGRQTKACLSGWMEGRISIWAGVRGGRLYSDICLVGWVHQWPGGVWWLEWVYFTLRFFCQSREICSSSNYIRWNEK